LIKNLAAEKNLNPETKYNCLQPGEDNGLIVILARGLGVKVK
jgi:hypothetical protein